jgi:hypothetical protein
MLPESRTETWDSEAVQQEAMFYCVGTDSSPKSELQEQRDLILYTPCKQVTEARHKI